MKISPALFFGLAFVAATAACPGAAAEPKTPPALTPDSSIDEILDALDARGDDLHTLRADVAKADIDTSLGEDPGNADTRLGSIVYERRGDGDIRIRASFDRIRTGEKVRTDRVEYTLDNGVLVDRNYRSRVEVRRIVQRSGEKLDLFKLGQGPFPLPIGQDKSAVHAEFEVSKPAPATGAPANTVQIRLVPRPQAQLSRKFKSIDVWVDLSDHLPRRIETLDVNETTTTRTELSNVRLNAPVADADFALEKISPDEWQITEEGYRD